MKLALDSISNQAPIDEVVTLVRFQLTCERGKVALGLGDNSLGNRVAGLFAEQELVDVQVYVNDKASAVFPPYASAEQRVFVEDERQRLARGHWNWSESETRSFFLAGGRRGARLRQHLSAGPGGAHAHRRWPG